LIASVLQRIFGSMRPQSQKKGDWGRVHDRRPATKERHQRKSRGKVVSMGYSNLEKGRKDPNL